MRIVAGIYGGRRLKSPPGQRVRPTPDKVREALFSILADRVQGASVLDLFAGTGALGLEALSRGARQAHFVEQSAPIRRVIKENIESLGVEDQSAVLAGTIPQCFTRMALLGAAPDLILADPPYGKGHPEVLLKSVALANLADPGAWLVIELPRGEVPDAGLWRCLEVRHYGDTWLAFFTLEAGSL